MYQFSDEFRQAYESLTIPIVIDQFIDEKVVPLLVSDGFCQLTRLDRAKALALMGAGQYDRVHPDNAGKVARVSDDFAHRRIPNYDQLVRARHEDGYHLIHVIGRWQTMSDGTELAFMVYTDVSSSKKVIEDSSLKYLLFRTALPRVTNCFCSSRVSCRNSFRTHWSPAGRTIISSSSTLMSTRPT